MSLRKDELLRQLAEESIYSAKGHYKTADWLNVSLAGYIFIPLTTSLLLLLFTFPDLLQRILSFLGFLFASLALNSAINNNKDKGNKKIENHQSLGDKYLDLYKRLRTLYADLDNVTVGNLKNIQKELSQLDNTKSLHISFMGRLWSKSTIKKEMDMDWLYKN
jgi:hypothetical protein